jgi:hypothetical protein
MRLPLRLGFAILLVALGLPALAFAHRSTERFLTGETIERGSGMAGTLDAIPDQAERGGRIAAAVHNTGEARMAFGLGFEGKRRAADEWIRIRDPFTTGAVIDIGLLVPAGETAGPRYGGAVDRFRLRAHLPPGKYKLIKAVSRGFRGPSLRLNSRFEIRED